MKKYKVVFHFSGEDTKELHVKTLDRKTILESIYADNQYFDYENSTELTRICLDLVTYISITGEDE